MTMVCVSGPGSRLYVAPPTGLLDLDAPTNLATMVSRLSTGLLRWSHFAFPGDATAASQDYSRQNTTYYAVGEHIFVGDRGYVCTTSGTTAGSAPSFTNTTIRSKGSNSGGSTTTDGTAVWEYVLNVASDFGGGSWDGGSASARCDLNNEDSLWYYDTGLLAFLYRDRLDRRSELTTDIDRACEAWASQHTSNMLERGVLTSAPPGYEHFSDTLTQDFMRQSRFKHAAVVTLADLLEQVTEQALYSYERGSPYYSGGFNGWDEDISREIAYYLLNCVNYTKANGGTAQANISQGGSFQRERFLVAYCLNHMRQWMESVVIEVNGFAPFMFALTAHSLIQFYENEVANARDPNRFCISGQIGTNTNTSAVDFDWTTIPEALEEFTYWMRFTSTSSVGTGSLAMWDSSVSAYRYRTIEGAEEGGVLDLGNLICPVHAWLANHTLINGNVTAWTPTTLIEHADEQFNASVAGFFFSITDSSPSYFAGKHFAEGLKLILLPHGYLASRNAASGRND
jgi:hypothetical protein